MNLGLYKLLTLLPIGFWATGSLLAASPVQPNIIFVMADDMGFGDLGCYNTASKIKTPHLDALAKQGMRFTDAHAPAGLCIQTRYGLLTGRYPFRTTLNERSAPCIAEDRLTIGKLMQQSGYSTAMFGKWHLGFVGGKDKQDYSGGLHGGPVDRGFDYYFGIPASLDIPPYYWIENRKPVLPPTNMIADNFSDGWSNIQGAFWRKGRIAPGFKHADVLPTLTRRTLFYLDQQAQIKNAKPFFLYLALPAPHTPWMPAGQFAGKSGAGMYGDFVMMVDNVMGQLLKKLDEYDMTQDTLVIFTSDNGPVWMSSDVKRLGHSSVGPLRGMKADAYEGGHRVPFIVRWPGKTPTNSVSNSLICHTDMLATFAAVVGKSLPEEMGEDSINMLAALKTPAVEKQLRQSLITNNNRTYFGVRMGTWKMITGLGSGGFTQPRHIKPTPGGPQGQLYNLKDDLGETNNLWDKHPDIVSQMQELLPAK